MRSRTLPRRTRSARNQNTLSMIAAAKMEEQLPSTSNNEQESPPQTSNKYPLNDDDRIKNEDYYEKISIATKTSLLTQCLPQILDDMFMTKRTLIWVPRGNKFYSPEFKTEIEDHSTLFNAVCRTKTAMIICSLDRIIPPEIYETEPKSPQLLFPFYVKSGQIVCIAQLIRHISQPAFDDLDIRSANFLMQKFQIYGTAMINASASLQTCEQFCMLNTLDYILPKFQKKLGELFDCIVEFYLYDTNVYIFANGTFWEIDQKSIGVTSEAIRTKNPFIAESARRFPFFSFKGDPNPDFSVMCYPTECCDGLFVVTMRRESLFTNEDLNNLKMILQFIISSYNQSVQFERKKDEPDSQLNHIQSLISSLPSVIDAFDPKSISIRVLSGILRKDLDFDSLNPSPDKIINFISKKNNQQLDGDDQQIANACAVITSGASMTHLSKHLSEFLSQARSDTVDSVLGALKGFPGVLSASIFLNANGIELYKQIGEFKFDEGTEVNQTEIFEKSTAQFIDLKDHIPIVAWGEGCTKKVELSIAVSTSPICSSAAVQVIFQSLNEGFFSVFTNLTSNAANLLKDKVEAFDALAQEVTMIKKINSNDENETENERMIKETLDIFKDFESSFERSDMIKFIHRTIQRNEDEFPKALKTAQTLKRFIKEGGDAFGSFETYCALLASLICNIVPRPPKPRNSMLVGLNELYARQSVIEGKCAEVFLEISKDLDLNGPNEREKIDEEVCRLIISTSISRHFQTMDAIKKATREGFDPMNANSCMESMTLMLKAAELHELLKVFDEIDRGIAEEFYDRGEFLKVEKMTYLSSVKRREYIDREKSFNGYLFSFALPIFGYLSALFTNLTVEYNHVAEVAAKADELAPDRVAQSD